MAATLVKIKKKGVVEASIEITRAQAAVYRMAVRNRDGTSRREIGVGDNIGDVEPDLFEVSKTPSSLAKKLLVWWVTIGAPADDPDDGYRVTVRILQSGKAVGEPIVFKGDIADSKNVIGAAEFEVA